MNRKELIEFRWLAGMAPLVEKTDDAKAEAVEEAIALPLEPKQETIEVVPNAEMTEDLMEAAPEGLAKFLQLSGIEPAAAMVAEEDDMGGYMGTDVHPTDPKKFREVHKQVTTVAPGHKGQGGKRYVTYSHVNRNRADYPGRSGIPEHGTKQRFPIHGEGEEGQSRDY